MSENHDIFHLFRHDIKTLDYQTQRQLFTQFYDLIYRDIFFMLNDHPLTEDVIQISFMKALESGPKTRDLSNMKGWLRTVARNSAIDLIRKNKNHRQQLDLDSVYINKELAFTAEPSSDVAEDVISMLESETLYEVLAEINEDYRVVLICHYIYGMSYKEIQKELGITRQVLASRLSRARKKLHAMFTLKWGEWNG